MSRYFIEQEERARLSFALGLARPSHEWDEGRNGCSRCPAQSPFRFDRVAHLYTIQEEPF